MATGLDFVDAEAIRQTVEEIAQENLVFREAFRDIDASGIDNDTLRVPDPEDALAAPQALDPGEEYPEARDTYRKVDIERVKYGNLMTIPMEDQMDHAPGDLIDQQVDRHAREMAEFLDAQAYAELETGVTAAGDGGPEAGDGDGVLDYEDAVDALTTLEDRSFEPDICFVSPLAKKDLLTDENFTRASDMGDDVVFNGVFGEVAGVPFAYSNTGDLAAPDTADEPAAIMVDTDLYGYEATWVPIETETDDNFDTDEDQVKIRTLKGWKGIKSDAVVGIDA